MTSQWFWGCIYHSQFWNHPAVVGDEPPNPLKTSRSRRENGWISSFSGDNPTTVYWKHIIGTRWAAIGAKKQQWTFGVKCIWQMKSYFIYTRHSVLDNRTSTPMHPQRHRSAFLSTGFGGHLQRLRKWGKQGGFPVWDVYASINLMITIYEWPIKPHKNRSTAKYQHSKSASRGKQNRRFGGDLQNNGIVVELDWAKWHCNKV